jgi:hypothetical protein
MNIDRAIEMLDIAAMLIRDNCGDAYIHYGEADFDGYCVADDCESAAEGLRHERYEKEKRL